jgi:predicted dehydrogenase
MMNLLRVGVIGLGRRWHRRYRPALRALRDRFEVRAVWDQVERRAAWEARRLRCAAAAGPTALLQSPDVDVLLLLDPQWFRLWPLEVACRLGKPVFCAASLKDDAAHADALRGQVQDSRLPVMMALAPRVAPATARLRELLATELGPARVLVCHEVIPHPPPLSPGENGERAGPGIASVDWCLSLLGDPPVRVVAAAEVAPGFASLVLGFAGDRVAQVTRWRAPQASPVLRLHVAAERGSATVVLPGRVWWSGAQGQHLQVLREPRSLARLLLERFHQAATQGQAPEPDFHDAYRALGWLRAAAGSRAEGWRGSQA